MKEKMTRNIGLKILSIVLAAFLWLIITNVDDPIIERDFTNIPVKIINKEAVESLDLVYDIVEGETIDFSFAARRSIADKLSSTDFTVTADFSKLSDVNAVSIEIEPPDGEDITITDGLYQVMKVNLEELVEKNFKVNVVQEGTPEEGYYVYEKSANTIIKVSGPKTKIESIAQIVAEVDVSGMAGTFKTPEQPKALDEEGNVIDDSNLEFSTQWITITMNMYKTKMIDLLIDTSGHPATGYVMTGMDYEPKTIEVAGEDKDLQVIQSLTVTEDLADAAENIEKEVNIEDQLPDGLILVGDNKTATVNIGIEKAATKEFLISTDQIEIRNKPADLEAVFVGILPVSVLVSGPAEEMKDLSLNNLKPYIDMAGSTGGYTYDFAIGIDVEGYISLANNPTVKVYLK